MKSPSLPALQIENIWDFFEDPLGRRCFRAALFGSAAVFAVAVGAALIRLFPWLFSPEVPAWAVVVFGRVLLADCSEAALLLGVPVGCTIAAAGFVESGEARALFALGASPMRLVLHALPCVALLALGLSWFAGAAPARFETPAFLDGLVAGARRSCTGSRTPHVASIPGTELVWLCFPAAPPVLVGAVPGSREQVWFSARGLLLAPEASGALLDDVRLLARGRSAAHSASVEVNLHAGRALIPDLLPVTQRTPLSHGARTGLLAVSALFVALVNAAGCLRHACASRPRAGLYASAAGVACLALFHGLDGHAVARAWYVSVPVLGLLAAGFGWRLSRSHCPASEPVIGRRRFRWPSPPAARAPAVRDLHEPGPGEITTETREQMQSSIHPATSGGLDETAPAARALTDTLRDLVQLTKPRVTWMVLVTTACGAFAAPGTVGISRLSLMLLGLSLVVGSANAFNMYLERDTDAAMRRTRERPLPAGRLAPEIALVFAGALAVVGLLGVTLLVNPVCGLLSAAALGTYVLLYTPLKRLTPWALHVGAVPGAIPPLIGWASVTGSLNFAALTLFLILLVWQLPHFLAIAIFRQSDYEAAGLRVLPAVKGLFAAKLEIVLYAVLLLGASVLPVYAGIAGPVYLGVALALGLAFAGFSLYGLRRDSGTRWARRLFFASMPYLILVFGALVIAAA